MREKILSAGGSPLTNILNPGEIEMTNFIIGIIFGFFVSTYGVSGVAEIFDKGLAAIKTINVSVEK
jgi:hypothetical protein